LNVNDLEFGASGTSTRVATMKRMEKSSNIEMHSTTMT